MVTTLSLHPLNTAALAPVRERISSALSSCGGRLGRAAGQLFAAGGKHLRPALVLLCARAAREALPGRPEPLWGPVYDVAAAVELIHVASLIHDDVIDEAAMRRGAPSVNAEWGNHTAVLAGDYLFAAAFRLLGTAAPGAVMALMTKAIGAMCEGEILQKEQAFDPAVTEAEYFRRIEGKTAALLSACCEAGARLAGADDGLAAAFGAYGRKLGLAYQIADDVLDLTGTREELGKPGGSDLKQGILTLPVIHLLRNPAWRRRLAPILASRDVDDAVVAEVREATRASGALHRARETAERLAAEAARHLEAAGRSEAASTLAFLSAEAVRRTG